MRSSLENMQRLFYIFFLLVTFSRFVKTQNRMNRTAANVIDLENCPFHRSFLLCFAPSIDSESMNNIMNKKKMIQNNLFSTRLLVATAFFAISIVFLHFPNTYITIVLFSQPKTSKKTIQNHAEKHWLFYLGFLSLLRCHSVYLFALR